MKFIALVATAILAAGLGTCSVKAQTATGSMQSPNLVGAPYSSPTGTTPITTTGGGYSGGNQPGYNSTTNTIYFGYTQSAAAYTYAFNEALRNSGMTILGYNYSWSYLNQGEASGNLSAAVNFAGTNGTSLHYKSWTLGPTTNWTTVAGTETFANNGMAVSSIANFSLTFNGKDSRFWAGYYGPQVKDPSLSLNYTFDQCSSNPLSSPTCPGYAAAYLTQQCTANPLYNTSCPGYAAAYQIQQCTINPLSDPSCPGYATAYLNYQCSVNPLYNTTCAGYQTAYKNQQCSISPLYATDCPGYEQAYLNAQCIRDSLYSNKCEGYATAYAIKYLVTGIDSTVVNQSLSNTAAVKANDPTTVKVATNTASTTINTDGTVSTGVSATGDTNVDKVITSKASTSGNQPAAAVQLTPNTAGAAVAERRQEQKQDDKKAENKPEGGQPQGGPQGGQQDQKSDQPKTARQELQERRQEAAKAKAVEQGKDLAKNMGKAADMEQQKQIQNVVIQAMGFTPGFDAYKVTMPDVAGYKPYSVYANQKTVDNRRLGYGLFGPTDNLHKEMVDSQYNRGN
jgi:hypothetical protein